MGFLSLVTCRIGRSNDCLPPESFVRCDECSLFCTSVKSSKSSDGECHELCVGCGDSSWWLDDNLPPNIQGPRCCRSGVVNWVYAYPRRYLRSP